MNKTTRNLLALVLLSGAAVGVYFWQRGRAPEPRLLVPVETPHPTAPAAPKPPENYPIPAAQDAALESLPTLSKSDPALWAGLSALVGPTSMKRLFYPNEMIRHIVVTIDNLPRETMAARLLPIKPAQGKFMVAASGKNMTIAPENAGRYMPYIRFADMVGTKRLVAVYIHFYPLFQRAYEDLGYPNGYFNNRLVAVIDHLLAVPEVEGPLALAQPHVLYTFADPALEARSAGQKILLRIGRENAVSIKAKLREIRSEVTAGAPVK